MKKDQVIICPHCGNKTTHKVLHQTTAEEILYDEHGNETASIENYHFLTECVSCSELSLFYSAEYDKDPFNLADSFILYPTQRKFDSAIPLAIMQSYEEAKKVEKISPIAFSVLIRRSLEFLCQGENAVGKTLKEQIDDLGNKGVIPMNLSNMGHTLRSLGNVGAHASEIAIDKEDAKILDDFFVAIIEYVYIAPGKIKKLKEKIEKGEAESNLSSLLSDSYPGQSPTH